MAPNFQKFNALLKSGGRSNPQGSGLGEQVTWLPLDQTYYDI